MHVQKLPHSSLPAFAHLNNIHLNGLTIGPIPGAGIGLKHTREYHVSWPFLIIGRDLVVCAATVEEHAKSDPQLAEVLRAVGEFALTPRGAIMVFLAITWSTAAGLQVGQRTSWCEYIKFLPSRVPVPTTWTDTERGLLEGTSLHVAVKAKLQILAQEFEHLQSSTSHIKWCTDAWWDEQALTLSDWTHLDSLFRSRVLQLPRLGVGMAPFLDFANHSENPNSWYSINSSGDVVLFPREENKTPLQKGEEITINYGIEKSGAELVFTYGFLPPSQGSALWLALDLTCQSDDPLALAKEAVLRSAPILRLIDLGSEILWTGDFVWLMCVNEEDGLSFRVLQSTDGGRQLRVMWKEEEVDDISKLEERLEVSGLWEVYQLRALMLVQERVGTQLGELARVEEKLSRVGEMVEEGDEGEMRGDGEAREVAGRLRKLERRLMEKAVVSLENQKEKLLETEVVKEYLKRAGTGGGDDDIEEVGVEVEMGEEKIEDDDDDDLS